MTPLVNSLRGVPALTLDCPVDTQKAIDHTVIAAADEIERLSEENARLADDLRGALLLVEWLRSIDVTPK